MTEMAVQTGSLSGVPFFSPVRNPSLFEGDGQDPIKWLKEYDRVAKHNKWDEDFSLANVYFFLKGTARQWFENNEDQLTSWQNFTSELTNAFGDKKQKKDRAELALKVRAQKNGESTQSYIQSVLQLCQEVNSDMPEEEKISHLMKGIAEDFYQALLTKELKTTKDFITSCQYIEEMKRKRVNRRGFDRLPNVVPMSSLGEEPDLTSLIRQIVKEEIQQVMRMHPKAPETSRHSIESIVREELQEALAPLKTTHEEWSEVQRRNKRQPPYTPVVKIQPPIATATPRATDLWRTEDNRPVCFHCGRPGHVVRYCRDRRAIFDEARYNRRSVSDNIPEGRFSNRMAARSNTPSPVRGRSPQRRSRSPSPYRRDSFSPSRRSEEN